MPQLQELSAWLATKRDDVFAEVLSSDPEVLIRSDVANADEATRAKLADSLLAALDFQRLHDMSLDLSGTTESWRTIISPRCSDPISSTAAKV